MSTGSQKMAQKMLLHFRTIQSSLRERLKINFHLTMQDSVASLTSDHLPLHSPPSLSFLSHLLFVVRVIGVDHMNRIF